MANHDPANDDPPIWFWLLLALGALMAGAGILILGIKTTSTAPALLLRAGQVLIGVVVLAAVVALAVKVIPAALARSLRAVRDIRDDYPAELKAARNRVPSIAAALCLIGNGVVLISDKVFPASIPLTLVVALALTTVFWLANDLLLRPIKALRIAGGAAWCVALLLLPAAVMLNHGWSVQTLVNQILTLEPLMLASLFTSFLLLVSVPFAISLTSS
jgi:hypothetical protein